jgi:glyoxylase-like metal-dependent hydrolase (beta-lactamase superfamily II)
VDPGGDVDKILERVRRHGFTVKYLLHTHAHFDHILGTRQMHEKTGASICLHKKDLVLYENLGMQCQQFGFDYDEPLPVGKFLEDEEAINFGTLSTKILHTPGHTPGSVCFNFDTSEKKLLLSGDTLFQRSIGRTDLWGGSFEEIIASIKNRLFTLDEETQVIPGHGPATDIWSEKRKNPFVH